MPTPGACGAGQGRKAPKGSLEAHRTLPHHERPERRPCFAIDDGFSVIAATRSTTANLTGNGVPEQVAGRAVTPYFFQVLGVTPIIGRTFTNEEDRIGAQIAVISHGLWQLRFGGDRSIVGQTMLMNGRRHEIIGVMPRAFVFRNRDVNESGVR